MNARPYEFVRENILCVGFYWEVVVLEAYCVKCKSKREMQNPEAVFTATGTPGTRGTCAECGTNMFRMGKTEAHEGLEPPKNTKRRKKKKERNGKLVVVESPAKARTIGRYLGDDYRVKASVGHIRDLLKTKLSVDVENNFEPRYRVPNEKRDVVKEIKRMAEGVEEVILATDMDREGEAIAWHLMESAELDPDLTKRVVFHEITRTAIQDAFANPAGLNMDLVNAQQGRRILDRLVGYKISPILWKKVRSRLSAGRVQSVALRLIVEREREIEAFVPDEYWSVDAELRPDHAEGRRATYVAGLSRIDGNKFKLESEEEVKTILGDMENARYQVRKVRRGERRRNPYSPFTTSTLQQDASRQLNYSAKKTMAIAQQLYEGIDVGNGGETGLITYMRTDSTHVSELAQKEARVYIQETFGEKYLPQEVPEYETEAKRAQEAHEAIRPTGVNRTPNEIKKHLTRSQYQLYELIWQRFLGSQMAPAVYDTLRVIIGADGKEHAYLLRASGSSIRFPGFLKVYDRSNREERQAKKDLERIPKDLKAGQDQDLERLLPEQHFTKPPARYSEASLVSELEENGIGRPSTYAPIMDTLQRRAYVQKEDRRLAPTEIGVTVNDLLVEFFPQIVDVNFTAKMESNLDQVASGEQPWQEVVEEFYGPFSKRVEHAREEMPEVDVGAQPIGRKCPECGHDLVLRWGRHGKFIGCSHFPECRHTEPWLEKIGVTCPEDGGDIVKRRTRRGRVFYGCSNYPECEFSTWKRPLSPPCPDCGGLLLVKNKQHAVCKECEKEFSLDEFSKE
ncbi:MAG: type I DNA topoisomerase [Anaerolineales bacterium]|nr:type I DNA topoisomerase [Anaerolineales bacterium]